MLLPRQNSSTHSVFTNLTRIIVTVRGWDLSSEPQRQAISPFKLHVIIPVNCGWAAVNHQLESGLSLISVCQAKHIAGMGTYMLCKNDWLIVSYLSILLTDRWQSNRPTFSARLDRVRSHSGPFTQSFANACLALLPRLIVHVQKRVQTSSSVRITSSSKSIVPCDDCAGSAKQ